MRVLISGYDCRPYGGSEGANAWYAAREVALRGHSVVLLTRTSDMDGVRRAIQEDQILDRTLRAVFLSDRVIGPVGRGQLGVYTRYSAWQRRAAKWMRSHRSDFDVVHHVSWGSITLPVAAAFSGLPFVLGPIGGGHQLHPDHFQWLDGTPGRDRFRNAVVRDLIALNPASRLAARRAGVVLAANEETADLASRLGALRVLLMLPEGVRRGMLADAPPSYPAGETIVWIGRFFPLKAAGLAVRAFRSVLVQRPDATLTLIGDGPTRQDVMSASQDLIDEGRVRFLGKLPWDEAQVELGRARLHLFSSVRDSSSAQSLEAAALGVPTVGLDAFGLHSFCARAGFSLVDPFPSDQLDTRLGTAVSDCLGWDEDRWRMESEAALEFAGENTYNAKAEALESMYRQVVADLRRRGK